MTTRRIVTVLLTAGLLVLAAWIARNTEWIEIEVPSAPTGEAAANPFYAAQRLVEALGATSRRGHTVGALPPGGVAVITAWHWDLSPRRREAIESWVEAGGRLVLDRSVVGGDEAFARWSGIRRQHLDLDLDPERDEQAMIDAFSGPACRPYSETAGLVEIDPDRFALCDVDRWSSFTSQRTPVWALRDRSGIQVIRIAVGRGSVTVVNAMPFVYRDLLDADHARLLVAAAQLARGDEVHFLSEEDHPSLVALVWRHGAPAVLLALGAVAMAIWRAAVRFGPSIPAPDPARRSLAEQVRGTGRFVLRYGRGESLHAAMCRAVAEAAQRRISGYARLAPDRRAAALAGLTGLDAAAIADAQIYTGARSDHALRRDFALLETARRRLLAGREGTAHGQR